jgi:hypothetical protein
MALAHSVGDAVVQAYSRTTGLIGQDLYKIRIPMMLRWTKFAMSKVRSRSKESKQEDYNFTF